MNSAAVVWCGVDRYVGSLCCATRGFNMSWNSMSSVSNWRLRQGEAHSLMVSALIFHTTNRAGGRITRIWCGRCDRVQLFFPVTGMWFNERISNCRRRWNNISGSNKMSTIPMPRWCVIPTSMSSDMCDSAPWFQNWNASRLTLDCYWAQSQEFHVYTGSHRKCNFCDCSGKSWARQGIQVEGLLVDDGVRCGECMDLSASKEQRITLTREVAWRKK